MSNKITVWKFPTPIDDVFSIDLPKGAQILTVQVQRGEPCIWALVDPDAPKEKRHFVLLGTGHVHSKRLLEGCSYVGSYQVQGGQLVFHLWSAP